MKNQFTFPLLFTLLVFISGCTQQITADQTMLSSPPLVNSIQQETAQATAVAYNDSLISFKAAVNNCNYLKSADNSFAFLYAELKAGNYSPPESKKRPPLNISIVIDRSGSMNGDKIVNAKKAAEFVVDQLSEGDYFSVVMYDDVVDVVRASAAVTDKESIKRKIREISSRGSTNLHAGMMEGYYQVKSTFKPGAINRVLLLSDGLANQGITDPHALEKIAKDKNAQESITLSTFGIGLDFNENLMTNLSEFGSGNYYYIKNADGIPDIFSKEMNGLLNVVAQNTVLTVQLPVGVSVEHVYAYPYEVKDNTVQINFRDVFSSETKAVLLKLKIEKTITTPLKFSCVIAFDDATKETKEREKIEKTLEVLPVGSLAEMDKCIDNYVKEQIVLFQSNEYLESAMREVDSGNYDKARKIVSQNSDYLLKNDSLVKNSKELQVQKSNNDQYKEKIKEAEKLSTEEMKMMQKGSKYQNLNTRKKK